MSANGIAMVLSGFPRRSETFALNELLALEARGLLAAVFATKPGDGQPPQPDCEPLLKRVQFLPEASTVEQAAALVKLLGDRPIAGIHAYFAHTPAEVAAYAAQRLGVPFGFSVHARDARKVTRSKLIERAQQAACIITCNLDVAETFAGTGITVQHLPHGVNIQRFYPQPLPPAKPLRLLAVGRLVEKKGFETLIRAAAQLSFPFQLRIVGDGPEHARLASLIATTGLTQQVELCAGKTHADLPEEYAKAHLVVVPSIVDQTGDRDGLPNVVLEAMASGRPVIAGEVGAMRSAITPGYSGVLTPAGDVAALVEALKRLADDPVLCQTLGRNGRKRVEQEFQLETCTDRFCRFLQSTYC